MSKNGKHFGLFCLPIFLHFIKKQTKTIITNLRNASLNNDLIYALKRYHKYILNITEDVLAGKIEVKK